MASVEKGDESRQEKDVRFHQKRSGISKQSNQLITEDAADMSDGREKKRESHRRMRENGPARREVRRKRGGGGGVCETPQAPRQQRVSSAAQGR